MKLASSTQQQNIRILLLGGGAITESDLEYLNEGFVGNIINKIKEIIRRFIDWIKNIFRSVRELFSKKSKDTKTELEQVKKEVKKIEQDPNLDENEKEIKKQKAVQKIVKHSKESTNDTKKKETVDVPSWNDKYEKDSQTKLLSAPPKYRKCKYLIPGARIDLSLKKVGLGRYNFYSDIIDLANIIRDREYTTLEDFIEGTKTIINNIDTYKFESADEYWNFLARKYTNISELDSDYIIQIVEKNTKNFDIFKQWVDSMERICNKVISALQNATNTFTINDNPELINLYHIYINKLITVCKEYTQINLQLVGIYAKNIKPVEIQAMPISLLSFEIIVK